MQNDDSAYHEEVSKTIEIIFDLDHTCTVDVATST